MSVSGDTTMTEYTPTINEVRADYVRDHTHAFDSYQAGRSLTSEQEVWGSYFDAALAAHDAEVAANALRDAAQHIEEQWSVDCKHTLRTNQWADEYLTSKADRIERDAGNDPESSSSEEGSRG